MVLRERVSRVQHALSSPRNLAEALQVKRPDDEASQGQYGRWSNRDLDPTPPEQRRWSALSFFAFQFSIAFSPTTYNVGSSLYAIGLNWWTILIASIVSSALIALLLLLNSRAAAWYHIGYPTLIRSSAGIYGSLLYVFVRCVVAILYMAIQTLYAGYFVNVMLRCVFGHRWTDIPNHLPATAGITSAKLGAFTILWLLQFPFAFVHPSKVNIVFRIKAVIAPIGLLATMIWALCSSHGANFNGLGSKTVHGSALGWSFMKAINTIASNAIPPLVNMSDLARYADRPSQTYPVPLGLLVSKPAVTFIGMVITAAGQKQFGKAYWNMWDFYSSVLDVYWSPGARTLVFLGAGIQAFATFATNLSSNSIPVGSDLAGLFPRYFTIVRGQVLCFVLVWACVPWKLTYSASSFLTFLGSYLCFICPIVGIMIVDYWVIRRGNLHVPSLYSTQPSSPYFYWHGVNLRSLLVWCATIAVVIPGVSGNLHPGSVAVGAVRIYNLGFILSTVMGAVLYYISCRIWPIPVYPAQHAGEPTTWEHMKTTEGFFADDEPRPAHILDGMVSMGDEVSEKGDLPTCAQPLKSAL